MALKCSALIGLIDRYCGLVYVEVDNHGGEG